MWSGHKGHIQISITLQGFPTSTPSVMYLKQLGSLVLTYPLKLLMGHNHVTCHGVCGEGCIISLHETVNVYSSIQLSSCSFLGYLFWCGCCHQLTLFYLLISTTLSTAISLTTGLLLWSIKFRQSSPMSGLPFCTLSQSLGKLYLNCTGLSFDLFRQPPLV